MELKEIPDPDPINLGHKDDTGSKTSPTDVLSGQIICNSTNICGNVIKKLKKSKNPIIRT